MEKTELKSQRNGLLYFLRSMFRIQMLDLSRLAALQYAGYACVCFLN